MKKYLRFGEIPEEGKSINYLKMNIDQREDFSYRLENGEIKEAYDEAPAQALEKGVSVFKMGKDGLPKLTNLALIRSMLVRLDEPVYEVSGVEVGRGQDDEPLLTEVKLEGKRELSKENLVKHAIKNMQKNFQVSLYDPAKNDGSNEMFHFAREEKENILTGERKDWFEKTKGPEWIKIPDYKIYCINGWTFYNPIAGFKVEIKSVKTTGRTARPAAKKEDIKGGMLTKSIMASVDEIMGRLESKRLKQDRKELVSLSSRLIWLSKAINKRVNYRVREGTAGMFLSKDLYKIKRATKEAETVAKRQILAEYKELRAITHNVHNEHNKNNPEQL